MGASGSQSGTTRSAIADGTITITSGDAASVALATTISRDTANANAGALTQQFDATRRAEIEQSFAVTRELANQTATFFANRARDEQEAEREAIEAGVVRDPQTGDPVRDENGRLVALNATAQDYIDRATGLRQDFGAGSPARLLATALNGAAGGNAASGLQGLVQATAVNVLQGLAASVVRDLADSFTGTTTERETLRSALHAVVGCAGAAAQGGDCASGATGAAASVVINNVLTSLVGDDSSTTLQEQQARADLIAGLAGALSAALGGDVQTAALTAQIESENNYLTHDEIENLADELEDCDDLRGAAIAQCRTDTINKYKVISAQRDLAISYSCAPGRGYDPTLCAEQRALAEQYVNGQAFRRVRAGITFDSNNLNPSILASDIRRTVGVINTDFTVDPLGNIIITAINPTPFQEGIGATPEALENDAVGQQLSEASRLYIDELKENCGESFCNIAQRNLFLRNLLQPGIDAGHVMIETSFGILLGEVGGPLAGRYIARPLINRATPVVNRVLGRGAGTAAGDAGGAAIPAVRVTRQVNAARSANAAASADDIAAANRQAIDALNPANAQIVLTQGDLAASRLSAAFQTEYNAARSNNWLRSDGRTYWPPNDGSVVGTAVQDTIPVNTLLDRFGGTTQNSAYLSPVGTPISQRALAPATDLTVVDTFMVIRPLPVQSSTIAPWFGQVGGGTQYRTTGGSTGMTIEQLIDEGYLIRIRR